MDKNEIITGNGSSIVMYTSEDGTTQLDVKFENETVWLSMEQISKLFERDRTVILRHIRNIFKEGELTESLVCAKFAHTKNYGRREGYTQVKDVTYYNLDVIISVGYRVRSLRGTQFRIWANKVLKDYLMKDYAINQRRLDHYNELKDVVRLMSRAITLQEKVTDTEFGGLFNVISDYVYALDTLVALTLMIAESRTEEKDVMVKVVVNLINKENQ